MNIAKHLVTKDETGRRKPGALVWLAVFAVACILAFIALRPEKPAKAAGPAATPRRTSKVKSETFADGARNLRLANPSENKPKQPRSDRGAELAASPDPTTPTATPKPDTNSIDEGVEFGSLNALVPSANNAPAGEERGRSDSSSKDGRPELDEGGQFSGSVRSGNTLTPAYVNSGGYGNEGQPKLASIDFAHLSYNPGQNVVVGQPSIGGQGSTKDVAQTAGPRKTARRILPRGERIYAFLLDTVRTGNLSSYIELAVAKPVYFDGDLVMPFGARLIAAAESSGTQDRVQVSVTAVRFMNRLELPLSGIAKDPEDMATGVRAYWIAPPTWVQLAPYVTDFMTALMQTEAQQLQSQSLSVAGVTLQSNPNAIARADVVSSASQAITDLAAKNLADVQKRYQSYYTIPAGSLCVIQLTSPFNADPLYEELPAELPIKEQPLPTRPSGTDAFPPLTVTAAQTPGAKNATDKTAAGASSTPASITPPVTAGTATNASADVTAADFFGSK